MSRLFKNQQDGVTLQSGGRPPLVRDINVDLWAGMKITYQGKNFQSAPLACIYARKDRDNRDPEGKTPDMLWCSPLIKRDDSTKPPWVQSLLKTITTKTALAYESPKSPSNFTSVVVENPDTTCAENLTLSALGTWSLQLVGETTDDLMSLMENVIDLALLGDSWTVQAGVTSKSLGKI